MKRKVSYNRTQYNVNQSTEGETIEHKFERILNNNEPITDGAPIIYTERKNGVEPAYNIRTDRFEVALEGMDKIHKSALARRENSIKNREEKAKMEVIKNDKNDGGAESIQGTN